MDERNMNEPEQENPAMELQKQHVQAFQQFLAEKQLGLETLESDTHVAFRTLEKTPHGAEPEMIIAFRKPSTDVELYARAIIRVPDHVEDLPVLNALNDFNQEFKYFNVILDSDRDVTISSTLDLDHGFNPAAIFGHSVMMFQASDEVYDYMTKLFAQITPEA